MSIHEIQDWNDAWKSTERGLANPMAFLVAEEQKPLIGKHILDLGCGDLRDTTVFLEEGATVVAVDSSEGSRAHAEALGTRVEFVHSSIEEYAFPEKTFDIVYAHLSLHYFDDSTTRSLFARIARALKPGGVLYVKCKSTKDPLYGQGELVGPDMYISGHLRHFFSAQYLDECLKEHFTSVEVMQSEDEYEGHTSGFVEALARV